MQMCKGVFDTWLDQFQTFRTLVRELAKRRNVRQTLQVDLRMRKCSALSDPIAIKIKTHHEALRFRLEEVRKFREQHEQLLSVIKRVLKTFQAEQGIN
jgi:hypothetical protein